MPRGNQTRFSDERPWNAEPEKCSELIWATASSLPADVIPYVRAALETFPERGWFREFGWEAPASDRPEYRQA
jgi:hypothetical protein